jgi:HAD superfamily 5'-nucleotidase-like hydrolase
MENINTSNRLCKFWVRGLIIDTQRGNFLKIDRHKYVRVAYHGFTRISSRTRKDLYSRFFNQVPSFSEKQYVNMDTLFQFVDASLFASLIEMKDNDENEFLDFKTYEEIYRDVRECVDLCHRDGVIKDEVARNPEKYIILDDDLVPMLKRFRDDGIKVFLLTNSHWEYTSVAMNYLYHQADVDPELKLKNEWTDLFDVIVVGSCKPAYLVDPYLNLFRCDPQNGSLRNTDGLFEIEALGVDGAKKFLSKGKIFQGGNWKHLTAMLEIEAGEEILYVGDHLYSDVLRSKRTLGWRSVFIMPELPEEMDTFYRLKPLQKNINELRKLRDELSVYGDTLRLTGHPEEDAEIEAKLKTLEEDDERIKVKLTAMTQEYHEAFHKIWGMMFQAGYQDSRLAYFVTNYACLYTSKATNLGLTSTKRAFRTNSGMLPHDSLLFDDDSSAFDI